MAKAPTPPPVPNAKAEAEVDMNEVVDTPVQYLTQVFCNGRLNNAGEKRVFRGTRAMLASMTEEQKTANGDVVSPKVRVLDESVAPEAPKTGIPANMSAARHGRIRNAFGTLDHANDDHWQDMGEGKVDVPNLTYLSSLVATEDDPEQVTMDELKLAVPDFTRQQ